MADSQESVNSVENCICEPSQENSEEVIPSQPSLELGGDVSQDSPQMQPEEVVPDAMALFGDAQPPTMQRGSMKIFEDSEMDSEMSAPTMTRQRARSRKGRSKSRARASRSRSSQKTAKSKPRSSSRRTGGRKPRSTSRGRSTGRKSRSPSRRR